MVLRAGCRDERVREEAEQDQLRADACRLATGVLGASADAPPGAREAGNRVPLDAAVGRSAVRVRVAPEPDGSARRRGPRRRASPVPCRRDVARSEVRSCVAAVAALAQTCWWCVQQPGPEPVVMLGPLQAVSQGELAAPGQQQQAPIPMPAAGQWAWRALSVARRRALETRAQRTQVLELQPASLIGAAPRPGPPQERVRRHVPRLPAQRTSSPRAEAGLQDAEAG